MKQLDVSLISDLPPFVGMKKDAIRHLLDRANSHRYEKGATIFRDGEEAHSFFVLLDGHVRVAKINPDGEQIIARYISSGELFGIAKAMGRTTYPANAIAAVDCLAIAWPTLIWDDVAETSPGFAANYHQTVGRRLEETQERVMEMATAKVEQRVANVIVKLANQTGRKTDEGILIDFPISRQDISEMTGTTLHTVSRLMSGWEHAGWVKSGRQKITLVEGHKLMMVASGMK
ncbi:MAG: Crp/Fnr family transcriptional regulator [Stappiaceae bacterium]